MDMISMTVAEALELYTVNVQDALAAKGESMALTESEVETVRRHWEAADRCDLCAAMIRIDRSLARH
jgi:hypothetical protein